MTETTQGRAPQLRLTSIPNMLTVARLVLVPVIALALIAQDTAPRWIPLALFLVAAVTDYFDGAIARSTRQTSIFGKVFDPIADKLLICGTLLALAWLGELPGPAIVPALLILWREMLVAGLRDFVAGAQARLPVSPLAKWKTAVQMAAVGALLAAPATTFAVALSTAGVVLLWLAAALSLYTGLAYGLAVARLMRE
jgi:cardiolipin synthase